MSREFYFEGELSSSKSLVNRALIVRSYEPQIQLSYQSQSEDVRALEGALNAFIKGETQFQCKDAGTALRFLLPRLARTPGEYKVYGSERLLSRPHDGLLQALLQLGVSIERQSDHLEIQSKGWNTVSDLAVESDKSSQFLSGILLNAWGLDFNLKLSVPQSMVSYDYFLMTQKVVESFGMKIHREVSSSSIQLEIPKHQFPLKTVMTIESDMSSCLALSAIAARVGSLSFKNFPNESIQPDFCFLKIFQAMGIPIKKQTDGLWIGKAHSMNPIQWNLNSSPDVFPVLSVLLAQAEGVSELTGLSHLIYKESDRLNKVIELLQKCHRNVRVENQRVLISGEPRPLTGQFTFDPDHDHRMAMAAQLARFSGAQINILNPHVVNKSFPDFWKLTEPYL